jgi:hypothetical protein
VVTQTGTQFGAGTDAPVFIRVVGPEGRLLGGSEICLTHSGGGLFERGACDTFLLSFPADKDCGAPLSKASID